MDYSVWGTVKKDTKVELGVKIKDVFADHPWDAAENACVRFWSNLQSGVESESATLSKLLCHIHNLIDIISIL